MQSLRVRLERRQLSYEIRIGRNLRRHVGPIIQSLFGGQARKVGVISNARVFRFYGAEIIRDLRANDLSVASWLVPDGERFKTFRSLEKVLDFLADMAFERRDVVIALGGGVVGDMAGFAAAVYLRGVPLVQVPTTLLAQLDSSIGGKTGINLSVGKNLVGAFHQPSCVVIDTDTLTTLPPRELVSGFCEAVKQGVVSSRRLFRQTTDVLSAVRQNKKELVAPAMEKLLAAQCSFKASVVAGDERESSTRSDRRSRRILNFGHTTGHALEAVTSYQRFRHGEAVGYGMIVAGELSKHLGLLDASELESLREAVRLCGRLPSANDLDEDEIIDAMSRDKKSVAGKVKWVLLERIGRPRIVDEKEVSPRLLRLSLREGLRNAKE